MFRTVEFDPDDPEMLAIPDGNARFAEMGVARKIVDARRHPIMHRTGSLEIATILRGEVCMLLEDVEVHLMEGNVLIQRGTDHAWFNRGTASSVNAFALIVGLTDRDARDGMKPRFPNRQRRVTAFPGTFSACANPGILRDGYPDHPASRNRVATPQLFSSFHRVKLNSAIAPIAEASRFTQELGEE